MTGSKDSSLGASAGADLPRRFADRMISGLVDNNVLRGSWAEELVAHYLDAEPQPQWNYFDLDWNGHTVSVKHSVGAKAMFSIKRSVNAWEGGADGRWVELPEPKHLCNLYVFAHLPVGQTAPLSLDRILDADQWRFAICNASEMTQWFPASQKSATLGTLSSRMEFVPGTRLQSGAERCVQSTARPTA